MGKNTGFLQFDSMSGISFFSMVKTVFRLSVPAIMAQITSTAMQYIDSAMVGSLGAEASASIGLVSTTTWLINGLCIAAATGFSVQVAQLVGGGRDEDARSVFRQSLIIAVCIGLVLAGAAVSISGYLPSWLGGAEEIRLDASRYFFIYACALPFSQLRQLSGGMLQSCGDMKTPSILNIMLCVFDIIFNSIFIFPSREIVVGALTFTIPGAGLGVSGAALGTALAEVCTASLMLAAACLRSPKLAFKHGGKWKIRLHCIKTAMKISIPAAFEHAVMCGAYIASTRIVAPLGTVSVAANSLAVTAESFCYMPGYGISAAATTLVGQSIGAGRQDLAKRFARTSVILGIVIMSCTGAIMFCAAPWMFSLLTPSEEVRSLGANLLRIESFAEPLYAASIVCAGALRGAGDALVPSLLNLASMWGVRISSSILLVPHFGLYGVWFAMAGELCFRGIVFLIRLLRGKWLDKSILV